MIGLIAPTPQIPVAVEGVRRWQMEFGNFDLLTRHESRTACEDNKVLYTRSLEAISPPPRGTPEYVDDYLINTVARTYYYAFYHSFAAFSEKYAEKHNGKPPYVLPSLQYRWETGAAVSEEQRKNAVQRMDTYKEWLLNAMFGEPTSETETLVVLPIANAAPNYRDEPSQSPHWQSALDQPFLPPILGAPNIAIPIGEVPYASGITKGTEYLPVVIDITPQQMTWSSYKPLKTMELSRQPTTVGTGSRIVQCPKNE
ncbi:Amidase [Penicillium solitum]|uniref:Amidase n=1 Tax=Penicillium solitum TaxID=60172 RepID=UPI0032C3ED9F|nr:Amidase [Penicillium solitum]